jgi:hypothetical protein
MRKFMLALGTMSLTAPVAMTLPTTAAQAHRSHYRHSHRVYAQEPQTYRYRNCRPSSGTTGLIAGGVGGAVLGQSIVGHGLLGAAVGAGAGALGGRAIDRTLTAKQRCN